MASSKELVQYIADQLQNAGIITYQMMFGDYGIYCDEKIFGLICDNRLYVKITNAGGNICPHLRQAPPYNGAKPYYVFDDIDNSELLVKFISATCTELPQSKPKKRKDK